MTLRSGPKRVSNDQKKSIPEIPAFDAEGIRQLAALLTETGLTEIEIEAGGTRIKVARGGITQSVAVAAPAAAPTAPAPAAAADPAKHPGAVTSPMVGTVYLAPEPGSANFINVGDSVSAGQTLLIVEAMKTMNPIPAPKGGKVVQILIANEEPVEYGQPLVIIE